MKVSTKMPCECLTANRYVVETTQCIIPTPLRIATAFVPIQIYGPLYSPEEGWRKGTIFPELYSPYPY